MSVNPNPPGGMNLTLAIFALVGATLSIVGFIAHYIPQNQYGDFCGILNDISKIVPDDGDWQLLPSDGSDQRWIQRYSSILENVEQFYYLVTAPSYVSAFYIRTALQLRSLRKSASKLKSELMALSQIQRGKKIKKIMDSEITPPMQSSNLKAPTAKAVDDCECLPPV